MDRTSLFKKFSIMHVLSVVLICYLALFISCALLTYNSNDPSWFFFSTDPLPIENVCGKLGAQCAALLLFFLGSAALLIAPFLFFIGYVFMMSSLEHDWDRIVAFIAGIISAASLEHLYGMNAMMHGFAPGGSLGLMVCNGLHYFFDVTISFLFLHVVVLACAILVARLSFMPLVCYGSQFLRFLLDKERCIKPVIHFLSTIIVWMMKRAAIVFGSIKSLFDGSYVERSEQSIMEFEFDDIVHEQLHTVIDDPIWAQFGIRLDDDEHHYDKDQFNLSIYENEDRDGKEIAIESPMTKVSNDIPSIHDKKQPVKTYRLPPLTIFKKGKQESQDLAQEHEALAHVLEEKLARFGIAGNVVSIKKGPVITLFEYRPHIDSKISKIIALEDDLALALQAMSIRIIAPIPGTSVVGFEVSNKERETVLLSKILHSKEFKAFSGALPLVVGVDTVGKTVIADLVSMPHILIAGATGSGKSVALNVILISLLYQCKPDELKLILIDPKRLEFAPYADIPHLVFPIVTNPKEAAPILQWIINTMEERYEKMATLGVRNIIDYNNVYEDNSDLERLPFIVVMIDELSDLMMVAGKDIEERIARIAQMARAAGIHLVVATQRPSVDVITGIIKANFPSRISFKVTTKIDSRTILDAVGADKLLGKGDMLYLNTGSRLSRMHGAYVSDDQIEQVTSFARSMQKVRYQDFPQDVLATSSTIMEADQELYHQVVDYIQSVDEVSISLLQRKFRIGYNRSARVIDMLQAEGLIMPSQGGKMRKVIRS